MVATTQAAVTIIDEMQAVLAFLRGEFPDVPADHFGLQEVPEQPPADSFYIRFQNDSRNAETSQTIVTTREYQIIHFNTVPAVLVRMDALSRKCLYGRTMIPINEDTRRYARVSSFSFGNVLDSEQSDTVKAVIGVLSLELREARDRETYAKIQQVFARYTINTEI